MHIDADLSIFKCMYLCSADKVLSQAVITAYVQFLHKITLFLALELLELLFFCSNQSQISAIFSLTSISEQRNFILLMARPF
jgi:hypothetical protein